MRPSILVLILALALSAMTFVPTFAITPTLINYQGYLTDNSGNALDTTANVTFRIFDVSSGGIPIWTEVISVTSVDGLFNVELGNLTPISETIIYGVDKYLETQLGASPFSPRTQLVSVPYAIRIRTVDGANGGNISDKVNIGNGNSNDGAFAFVVGEDNSASGDYSSVGGGSTNTAANTGATIGGGISNQAQGPNSTVGGGTGNGVFDTYSTIGGGSGNTANGAGATIGGGYGNQAFFNSSTISGGNLNSASADFATVSGGYNNSANSAYNTVSGGRDNTVNGPYSSALSGFSNTAGDLILDTCAFVGGGFENFSIARYSTVGGGWSGQATGDYSTVGGGRVNRALATSATVAGGSQNSAFGAASFVGGGGQNSTYGAISSIGGGGYNNTDGNYSTVPGGLYNSATGNQSFAAGTKARANHDGTVVISANSNSILSAADSVYSSAAEQMVLRADGFFYLTNSAGAASIPASVFLNTSTGGYLSTAGVWTNTSDKNLKENFTAINGDEMLDRIAELEISQWNYKIEGEDIRHIGPTGQDFYEAFELGLDDKSISSIDASGVALAAIKALYQENQELKKRLEKLESKIK